ncbi:DUF4389 domain-containing protein [Nocardia anaemiae]|uniref:DUF4389 domain-containing protein n=1 Tax=Nocardia anaemiae TaxID=263910 RepID=UPI0007A54BE2|nr:DUF4389 domain-containing protein [Nocardia anaemiae]
MNEAAPTSREALVELDVFPPEQQRRWTVLLRLLLAIPQLIVLGFLSIAAFVVIVCGWFGALVLGRLPAWCGEFLRGYYGYTARVYGYLMLLVDDYPPFAWTTPDYPIRLLFPAPTRLNRLAVLFRLILAFPILVLSAWFTTGWATISIVLWLIVLITGRMPKAIFEASSAVLRIEMRVSAYANLLTPAYLKGVFGDKQVTPSRPVYTGSPSGPMGDIGRVTGGPEPAPRSATRPLVLSSGGRALLLVMLIIGILGNLSGTTVDRDDDNDTDAISGSQLARQVAIDFTDQTGRTPQYVHCPDSLGADIGATEVCTVTYDGMQFRTLVTVDAITDGAAHFRTVIQL